MRILLMACATVAVSGCTAFAPTETVFNRTLDRAHAVECNIKSLERTEHRTRLECFDWERTGSARSQRRIGHGADL